MADENIPTLVLSRTGVDPVTGFEKGYLQVQETGQIFSTRERGHGRVSYRVGTYILRHSIKRTKRRIPCLRPVESGIQTVLIHDAYKDDAGTLEGCVAPGIIGGEADWSNSASAMEMLWQAIGGFEEDKKLVRLIVINNVSYLGAQYTRENWKRLAK